VELRVAGVHALRREGEEEVLARRESLLLQEGKDELLGGPGIRRALEDHELPLAQVLGDRLRRVHDHGEVGVLRLAERSRHADDDRVRVGEPVEVDARGQALLGDEDLDLLRGHVPDVRLPAVDAVDLLPREVEAGHPETGARELHGERQADVAETDGRHVGLALRELRLEVGGLRHRVYQLLVEL
jgi:hypothetical protein